MPAYNLTGLANNSTTIVSFFRDTSNELTFGWLWIFILIAIISIMFIAFLQQTNSTPKAITASSFLGMILAVIMRGLNFIPDLALYIIIVAAAASLAFTWRKD